jgi:thioester reductase-like protein
MAIFLTGSTGYLGSYLAAGLFRGHRDYLNLLVRAKTQQEAQRLWQSLQLHMDSPSLSTSPLAREFSR